MKETYRIIGVMSGTSLDGLDLAAADFSVENNSWQFQLQQTETIAYSSYWKKTLKNAVNLSKEALARLDFKFTEKIAEEVSAFMLRHQIQTVDAVCSHGHTVFHKPEKGFTYQIGNLPRISQYLNQTVVCDFRPADVALGGQGAPLVPVGDRILFSEYKYCLNLGGFGNISFENNGNRIAYDTGPVNIVLNPYAEQLGEPYDKDGNLAASGSLNHGLFTALENLPYYKKEPPKSLGLEWVQKEVFPLLDGFNLPAADVLRTVTEHIAARLAAEFEEGSSVLITGGGAFNRFLISRLAARKNLDLVIPDKRLVEYKEALIFGLLGVLRLRNEINVLASVTGARHDHSSGKIYR